MKFETQFLYSVYIGLTVSAVGDIIPTSFVLDTAFLNGLDSQINDAIATC